MSDVSSWSREPLVAVGVEEVQSFGPLALKRLLPPPQTVIHDDEELRNHILGYHNPELRDVQSDCPSSFRDDCESNLHGPQLAADLDFKATQPDNTLVHQTDRRPSVIMHARSEVVDQKKQSSYVLVRSN